MTDLTQIPEASRDAAIVPVTHPPEPAQDDLSKIWGLVQKHPLVAAGGALVILGMLGGGGNTASETAARNQEMASFRKESQEQARWTELQLQAKEQEREFAAQMQEQCSLSKTGETIGAGIRLNMKVTYAETGTPAADGMFICDMHGNVGLVGNGDGTIIQLWQGPKPSLVQSEQSPAPTPDQIINTQEIIHVSGQNR